MNFNPIRFGTTYPSKTFLNISNVTFGEVPYARREITIPLEVSHDMMDDDDKQKVVFAQELLEQHKLTVPVEDIHIVGAQSEVVGERKDKVKWSFLCGKI